MTSITLKEYFAVAGSPYSNADARKIGPVINSLSESGAVTARDVVDSARSPNSPIHPYFEWDNQTAADLWRVETARRMLRSIRVKYQDAGGETRDVRAFQVNQARAWESEHRQYKTFQVLHGDSAFAAQMLGSAFDDLQSWKRKYEPYVAMWNQFGDTFQGVVNQISEWADEYKARNVAGETDDALVKLLAWRDGSRETLETWTACREQIEFILAAIGDAERLFKELPAAKTRPCIRCGKDFKSDHIGHRICASCAKTQKVSSGVGESTIEFIPGD